MTVPASWLPPLLTMADAGHVWDDYCNLIYARFSSDFLVSQPKFNGRWVRCRRDPISNGKEAGFWHCISQGDDEVKRVPEMPRCERIGWARAVIEHADDPEVDVWTTTRGGETRVLLWLDEYYLVVLAERSRKRDGFRYYQLITAYCVEHDWRRRQLRRDRDGQ